MRLVSFDALRTLGLPGTTILKPDHALHNIDSIRTADWVLYPEYWQVNALVFGIGARIFPSLPSYLIGHNKIEMTRAFEMIAPANTPETHIRANTPGNAEALFEQMLLPFVAKNPKASMGNGVFLIESHADWRRYVDQADVLYVQEHLPIDRDLRIVWVGKQVVGAYWRLQGPDGFHNNLSRGGHIATGIIPEAALELVSRVALTLGIDHAGFDVAMVDNHPYLLEFNRLFGNKGIDDGTVQQAVLSYLSEQSRPNDPDTPAPRLRRAS